MTTDALCSRCHRRKVAPPKRVCRHCARRSSRSGGGVVRGNAAAVLERSFSFPVASAAFFERPGQPVMECGPDEPAVVAQAS